MSHRRVMIYSLFFDLTDPSISAGRILNRLSRDMEVLDSSLSNSLRAVLFRLATFVASIATVAYVFPIFLIPACIISFFYYQISKGYVNAGRDMRRMQSTTRSPIFAGFAETLEGIVTVRAFSAERRFVGNLVQKVDLSTKVRVLVHFYSSC
jgi:ABC-type multidrug transport system fused ATPase/permease subunit